MIPHAILDLSISMERCSKQNRLHPETYHSDGVETYLHALPYKHFTPPE